MREVGSFLRELAEDPYRIPRSRKQKKPDLHFVGCYPVYSPVELVSAVGAQPVGILGGGTSIDITHADARFQSFVCSIAKSTLELGFQGKLDFLDAFLFHSICDVARNLASLYTRNFPNMYVTYIHFPQNTTGAALRYYRRELDRVWTDLAERFRVPKSTARLRDALEAWNAVRLRLQQLAAFRKQRPQDAPIEEYYAYLRLATLLPPEEFLKETEEVLPTWEARKNPVRDAVRVIVEGAFCEQPPWGLLRAIEQAGCYVVEDDLLKGWRWFLEPVPTEGDPLTNLAQAYLRQAVPSSVFHNPTDHRPKRLLERVRQSGADAVLFLIPKFCEPALFDYAVFRKYLDEHDIPHFLLEYEEKMWTYDRPRTNVETFVESMLFD